MVSEFQIENPSLLTPVDGATNVDYNSVIVGWDYNNDSSAVSSVNFTLKEVNAYGSSNGSVIILDEDIGKATSKTLSGLIPDQWYKWWVELVFTDDRKTGAGRWFKTAPNDDAAPPELSTAPVAGLAACGEMIDIYISETEELWRLFINGEPVGDTFAPASSYKNITGECGQVMELFLSDPEDHTRKSNTIVLAWTEAETAPLAPPIVSVSPSEEAPAGTHMTISWAIIQAATHYVVKYGTSPNNYLHELSVKENKLQFVMPNDINFEVYCTVNAYQGDIAGEPLKEIHIKLEPPIIDSEECKETGGYWYKNKCNLEPEIPPQTAPEIECTQGEISDVTSMYSNFVKPVLDGIALFSESTKKLLSDDLFVLFDTSVGMTQEYLDFGNNLCELSNETDAPKKTLRAIELFTGFAGITAGNTPAGLALKSIKGYLGVGEEIYDVFKMHLENRLSPIFQIMPDDFTFRLYIYI